MKKLSKGFLSVFFSMILIFATSLSVFASNYDDVLSPYKLKIQEFNNEMGTSYKIPTTDEAAAIGVTEDEIKSFYLSMSLDELENYLLEIYSSSSKDSVWNIEAPINNISTRATQIVQQYYYSANYFTLISNVVKINGIAYYNSVVGAGCNSTPYAYPYYKPFSYSYSPSSDSRQITVKYVCSKYLSKTLIDTGSYTWNVTYTATL